MTYTINLGTGNVTRDSDGVQVAPAQSVDDPLYVEYLAWVNAGNLPTEYAPPPVPPVMKITVLALRNRFTQVEKITIDMASIDNPAAPIQARQLAASLRVMMSDLNVATFVDLSRPDTMAGIQALETYGIIGPGRANEILTTDIQDIERAPENT
jgi:hypothetical protein